MVYSPISSPEIANGAIITQVLMTKMRDNLQAICDDDVTIPLANTFKRMGRQNSIVIGATDPGGSELLRVGGAMRLGTYLLCGDNVELFGSNANIYSSVGGLSLRSQLSLQFGSNAISNRMRLAADGTFTIGTDPGGTELLRVGGSIRCGVSSGGASVLSTFDNSGNAGRYVLSVISRTAAAVSVVGYFGSEGDGSSVSIGSTSAHDVSLIRGSVTGIRLAAAGAIIIGTDPGGSELLRVGGGIRANGGMLCTGIPNARRSGAAGLYRGYWLETNEVGRWLVAEDDASESGANAGSNFTILRYGDTGSYLGTPLNISRATGTISISGPVILGTDPGGSELLRVGGGIRAAGACSVRGSIAAVSSNEAAIDFTSGTMRLLASGANPATRGAMSLVILSSDANLYTSVLDITADTVARIRTSLVVGTDPGGAELLRVGGDIKTSTRVQITGAGVGDTPGVFLTNNVSVSFPRICFGSLSGGTTMGKANANLCALYASGASSSGMAIGTIGAVSMTLGTSNTARITIAGAGDVIIGTDPGGAELLRVGGGIRASQISSSGAITATDTLALTGAAGTDRRFFFQSAALRRWEIQTDSSPESGGGAGSNLNIIRYNDGGAGVGMPISINRATGVITATQINTGGSKITTATVVPPSFADLAAVRTWLALQFT